MSKRTFQPNNRRRAKVHGFRLRMRTRAGRAILGGSSPQGAHRALCVSRRDIRVVLARANRVVRPEDFRTVVRRGRRSSSPLAVYYRLEREPSRSGAVRVHRVAGRRWGGRAQPDAPPPAGGRPASWSTPVRAGSDVVVRALPGSAQRGWASLSADMHAALDSPS